MTQRTLNTLDSESPIVENTSQYPQDSCFTAEELKAQQIPWNKIIL